MSQPEEVDSDQWRDCDADPPPVYMPVTVMTEDGSVRLGFWSGSAWIAAGAEIKPSGWKPRE